jgi:hypothetical protein
MVDGLRAEDRTLVARAIAVAALISFVIESILLTTPTATGIVSRLIVYPVAIVFFWGAGWWLGTRTWPRRGARLMRASLRRRLRRKHALVFLSDRPDRRLPLPRRIWEVVGFSAGSTLLVTSTLLIFDAPSGAVLAATGLMPILTLWGSFILVPYWLYSRLGLRSVDAMRWLVLPLSGSYADRLKLSNGALVLLGIGATFNATLRAGASGGEAAADAVVTALRIVASVLIVAAAAVAYYAKDERVLSHTLELEAVAMGIQDGRGMSDGDFLPRLPAPKAP